MDKVVKFTKYIIFLMFFLFLLLIWKAVFVVQGAIGFDGPIYIIPIKFIPIFIASFIFIKLTIKLSDNSNNKKLVLDPKKACFVGAGVSIL